VFWDVQSYFWDRRGQPDRARKTVEDRAEWLARYRERTGESVLDIGCGTGDYSIALTRVGFTVLGIDFSPHMLKRAQIKAHRAGSPVKLRRVDFNKPLPFPGAAFDHAIAVQMLHCAADPLAFLTEVHRVLKQRGHFLLVALRANPPSGDLGKPSARQRGLVESAFWKFRRRLIKRNRWPRFEEDELTHLLESAGFQILEEAIGRKSVFLMCQVRTGPGAN